MKKTLAAGLAFALLVGCASHAPLQSALDRIDTIVVIYAENHSFDNMYGMFPGANGIANAPPESRVQRDHDGKPLASLPPVYTSGKPDAKQEVPSDLAANCFYDLLEKQEAVFAIFVAAAVDGWIQELMD